MESDHFRPSAFLTICNAIGRGISTPLTTSGLSFFSAALIAPGADATQGTVDDCVPGQHKPPVAAVKGVRHATDSDFASAGSLLACDSFAAVAASAPPWPMRTKTVAISKKPENAFPIMRLPFLIFLKISV